MIVLARGQTYNASNPRLVFYHQTDGWLSDLYSLEFQVFDVSTEEKATAPVQVYPAAPGTRSSVAISGADRLGVGRYAASLALASNLAEGLYEVRWFWKRTSTDTERRASQACDIIAPQVLLNEPLYCGVSDMRAEGIDAATASSVRLLTVIARASRYVEQVTGQCFEPRYQTFRESGRGSSAIHLTQVPVGLEQLEFPYSIIRYPVDPTAYVVYNRHLEGLVTPDDRRNPRVEVFYGRTELLVGLGNFTAGKLNLKVTGVFGYTEFDGTPFGRTPELLRRACVMLVRRDLRKLTDSAREDDMRRYRVQSESTQGQSYSLGPAGGTGKSSAFTGDPEIDSILAMFIRPPVLGAA